MQIQIKKKEIVDALKNVEMKGKWASSGGLSSKSLGKYIHFQLGDNRLLLINSDENTTAIKSVSVESENEGTFVLDLDSLKKYLTKMNEDITLEIGDTVVMKSDGKRATMPIVVEHPYNGRIGRFAQFYPFTFEDELDRIPQMGAVNLKSGIQMTGEQLFDAIDACEIVNNGIYKLNYFEEDDVTDAKFIVSSEERISSYREEIEVISTVGESSTVMFSGPIHRFFDKTDKINVFLGDDQPILMVTENSALVRAPRLEI
tara:strand:- start:308 stop:1084 length:777 start_codon:yes stop_codon:yes gene_type:complete